MKILVRKLARETSESSLKAAFEQFGAVQSCNVVMDKNSGESKGFAFVEMPKVGEAKVAISMLNDSEFEGSKLRVKKADIAANKQSNTDNDE
jgi:RNA recognition motif-containing protein